MSTREKSGPAIGPRKSARTLLEAIQAALYESDAGKSLYIRLRVSGGVASQAFVFDFEATGQGEAHCEMECQLTQRKGRSKRGRLDKKSFSRLLKKVYDSGVLEAPQERRQFLPDTLVGRLEIADGENEFVTYFAADAEQAKAQDCVPSERLQKAVDAIYAAGARLVNLRSVKP
jgi:hypothetical protein